MSITEQNSGDTPEIVALRARSTAAWENFDAARTELNASNAEWVRVALLELVAQHPCLETVEITFETEYCSDDEGGMYETATLYADWDNEARVAAAAGGGDDLLSEQGEIDDELIGINPDPDAVRLLCGLTDEDTGRVTVARLRELSL